MTDFLGRLIQRSLPRVDRFAASEVLSPRLPAMFEPTGNEWSTPSIEETSQSSDSVNREKHQNEDAPHPSVMPPTRASRAYSELQPDEIAAQDSLLRDDPMNKRAISTALMKRTTVQPQVRPHEAEKTSAQNERKLMPVSPTHPLPALNPTQQMKRPLENANAMIDSPSTTTVRINIGRIEVRAVQHPQSVTPAHKTLPQAKMTIEEYAKRRSEGKS